MALTEEIEHRIGVHDTSLSRPSQKDREREELEQQIAEFEARGNTIKRVPPDLSSEAKRFFNNQGELNPAKKRKGWSNAGIAKSY